MKIHLTFLFIIGIYSIQAQVQDTCSEYVQLRNRKIYCGPVEYKSPFMSKEYLLFNDSVKFDLSDVRFFKTKEAKYGIASSLFSGYRVVERIQKGKIDLYSTSLTTYSAGTFLTISTPGGSFTTYTPGSVSVATMEYFSKDGTEIRNASYGNLREAMSDNQECIGILNTHRALLYTQVILACGGIATVIASAASAKKGSEKPPAGIFIGIGIAAASWIPYIARGGMIYDAVETYNRK